MKKLQAELSRMTKSLWSMAIFAVLFVLVFCPLQAKASSEEQSAELLMQRLVALEKQYKDGKYWNHLLGEANNIELTTDTPCNHYGYFEGRPTECNRIWVNGLGYTQCAGFAAVLSKKLYGSFYLDWRHDRDTEDLKPGDVLRYDYSEGIVGHTLMVLAIHEGDVYVVDCNANSTCQIQWYRDENLFNLRLHLRHYPETENNGVYHSPVALPEMTWNLDEDGTLTISGCGIVYEKMFKNNDQIKKVIMQDGIFGIEKNAFENCVNLEEVILPDGLNYVKEGGFMGCAYLRSVTVPSELQELGAKAFYGCAIETFDLPQNLKKMGSYVFQGCPGFAGNRSRYYIEDGVLRISGSGEIYKECFKNRTDFTEVVIEEGISSIEDSAFERSAMEKVTLPDSLEKMGDNVFLDCPGFCGNYARYQIDGVELRISGTGDVYEYAFWGNTNLRRAYVGEGITGLGDRAFGNCSRLMEVEIPQSVCFIGAETFYYCSSLSGVSCHASPFTLEWESPKYSGETFMAAGWTRFYVAPGYLEFYEAKFKGQNVTFYGVLDDPVDPDAVLQKGQCGYYAFYDLRYDGTLIIEGFGEIDANSFDARTNSMWKAVKAIVIKDKIKGIGDEAFYGCSHVQTVTLPDSMAQVGAGVFTGCTELADVNCHADLEWFEGWETFEGNEVQVHVYEQDLEGWTNHGGIQAPVTFVGDLEAPTEAYDYRKGRCGIDAYYVIDEENTLTVTGSGEMVGIFCFDWTLKGGQDVISFKEIQKVILEEGITEIGEGAFYGMSSITEICLPDSLEVIGHNALICMRGLQKINLPAGLKKLEACTFMYCSALKTIDVPYDMLEIGEACFSGCTGIDEFTCRANPAELTWVTNSRDKDFKTGTPKTICHVPSNYLNGYLESFSHVNVTFVGDLDPELRGLSFEEIKARDASCTEDGTIACFLGSDGQFYENREGMLLTDQNGDGIVNQFDVILPATGHLHTGDSLIWRWEKDGEDFAVTACLKCMNCGAFEDSVRAEVVKTEGEGGVTYVATATVGGAAVSMSREIKNEYYVTIDGAPSTHPFGDCVKAYAAESSNGMVFAGWYEGETLVCNSTELEFLVSRNISLHTVYVNAEEYVEPTEPILNFDLSERVYDENGNQKLDMTVTWYLSDGMSV
ncbi:MAG: leucine-rich repeat protein, partial [Lachnospiraceae bacterium]|nr:leucine-rich repeat protein [Lachnospiraceae bacterium]